MQVADTSYLARKWPLGAVVLVAAALVVGILASPFYVAAAMPALGIAALLLFWIHPEFGYYLIVFLIPFDFLRKLSASSQWATISKFVGVWVLVVLFMSLVVNKRKTLKASSNLWPLLTAFVAFGLLSAVLSEYRETAFHELRRVIVALIFFSLTLLFARTKQGFSKALPNLIVFGMSLCSFLSVIGSVFHISMFAQYELNRGPQGVLRATGGSSDPNLMSAMALFAIPLIAYRISVAESRRALFLNQGLLAVNLYAIVLTYSRSGALMTALFLILLLLQHMRRLRPRHLGVFMIVGVLVVVTALAVIPESFWVRQSTVSDRTDASIHRRGSYLAFGWEEFKRRPFLGAGPGTFKDLYGNSVFAFYYGDDDEASRFRSAHNTYLESLVGGGLTGLVCFVLILLRAGVNYRTAGAKFQELGEGRLAALTNAYFLSFLAISLYLVFISALFHKYLWVSVAVSQIALSLAQETAAGARPPAASVAGRITP